MRPSWLHFGLSWFNLAFGGPSGFNFGFKLGRADSRGRSPGHPPKQGARAGGEGRGRGIQEDTVRGSEGDTQKPRNLPLHLPGTPNQEDKGYTSIYIYIYICIMHPCISTTRICIIGRRSDLTSSTKSLHLSHSLQCMLPVFAADWMSVL